jgi:hypothetical protein
MIRHHAFCGRIANEVIVAHSGQLRLSLVREDERGCAPDIVIRSPTGAIILQLIFETPQEFEHELARLLRSVFSEGE